MGAKYTDAQKKASQKYQQSLSSMSIRIKEDEYKRYKDASAKVGMSLREFILTALDEKIERMNLN